ncbi:MAG: hypothetical protein WBA97_28325 [Actinophytocola sp.]|uniref:hypothetical protein n=1 Tax=Actinophytocola sp. TaxID=1872138 RepID=UPI003C7287D8
MPESLEHRKAGSLAVPRQSVDRMSRAVADGDVALDRDVAPDVLRLLAEISQDVEELVSESVSLDRVPKLGNNFVAGVLDRRARLAAVAGDGLGGANKVFEDFQQIMHEYETSVGAAVRGITAADDHAAEALHALHREKDRDDLGRSR